MRIPATHRAARSAAHAELVELTYAATAVGLSVLLGNLRLIELPNGGSITLAALPLIALATVRGFRTALLACLCAGVGHALAGGTIVHPIQFLLDYVLTYGAIAIVAFAPPGRSNALRVWIVIAAGVQLACATISGVVFFAAPLGAAAWSQTALAASCAYNAATIIPETLLALWLAPAAVRSLVRAGAAASGRVTSRAASRATARRQPRRWTAPSAQVSVDTPRLTPVRTQRGPALVRPAPFAKRMFG